MAKTRRKHAYRKSKRWNPGRSRRGHRSKGRRMTRRARRALRAQRRSHRHAGRARAHNRRGGNSKRALNRALYHARGGRFSRRNPGPRDHQNDIPTAIIRKRRNCGGMRRNPAAFSKHLSDGSRVEVDRDGQVTVYDQGGVFSRYVVGYGRLRHFINDVDRAGKHSDKYSFQGESLKDEGSYQVQLNPKRGRGHRGHKRKNRSMASRVDSEIAGYSHVRGHGRRRRNPAQFPMPFVSAMNPKRRGRGKRRNPKISKSEAKAMRRVLRRHGR